MGDEGKLITGVISILSAIIGISIIATLVGQNAKTADVLKAGGNAFSSILKVALSPVGGSSFGGGGGLSLPGL